MTVISVTVRDKNGLTATANATADVTAPSGLPAGVTLKQIDGGPTYYADNNFTTATNAAFATSWDNPAFFPLGAWYGGYFFTQADVNKYLALHLNTAFRLTGNTVRSLVTSNHIWVSSGGDEGAPGVETMSLVDDEPPNWNQVLSTIGTTPNAQQDHRAWYFNFTWNQINYGDTGGVPMATALATQISTPNGTKRHIDLVSTDIYWFAGANTSVWRHNGGLIYNTTDLTADQMRRGSHYGNMIDWQRAWRTTFQGPTLALIETGDGFLGDAGKANITGPELNWAVWASIIHGCRGIVYFSPTNNSGESLLDTTGTYTAVQNQVAATNALVLSNAPIINSPFALGYATVTPAGYVFPTVNNSLGNGIDICAHFYNSKFYIFACTRNSEAATNIPATFTVKSGTIATVIGENRTIPIVGGTFTDTFAKGSTVHLYSIG